MMSHARVNSKSVRGAVECAVVNAAGCSGDADEPGVCGGSRGTVGFLVDAAGSASAGTSRVLNTVSFPDMRKMPPPTRPADILSSRTCFASLNDAGFGSGGVESNTRELMGLSRSLLLLLLVGSAPTV
jgi:hypothetical protein